MCLPTSIAFTATFNDAIYPYPILTQIIRHSPPFFVSSIFSFENKLYEHNRLPASNQLDERIVHLYCICKLTIISLPTYKATSDLARSEIVDVTTQVERLRTNFCFDYNIMKFQMQNELILQVCSYSFWKEYNLKIFVCSNKNSNGCQLLK